MKGPWAFFDRKVPWIDRAHYSHDGLIRSIRFSVSEPYHLELLNNLGLTIQVCGNFYVRRRTSNQSYSDASAVGRVFLDGPGTKMLLAYEGECRLLQLKLPDDLFEKFMIQDHDEPGGIAALRPINGEMDFELLRLLGWALLSNDERRELAIRTVVAWLVSRYGHKQKQVGRRRLSPVQLRKVRDLVSSDLTGVTLNAMAEESGLSLYHFSREFRRDTGQSPWDFVVQQRTWKAAGLLGDGDRSVDYVAEAAGFANAGHMGRCFRRLLGISHTSIQHRLLP